MAKILETVKENKMKQLTCEMCGSNDLLKEDGIFVCQTCGCKYSVEEAKKMMVEGVVEVTGTVKIDKNDEVENYRILGKRAIKNEDYENANLYYQKILNLSPNDWEGMYYASYINSIMSKGRDNIDKSFIVMAQTIETIFKSIKKYDENLISEICDEISSTTIDLVVKKAKDFLFFMFPSRKKCDDVTLRIYLSEINKDFFLKYDTINLIAYIENLIEREFSSINTSKMKNILKETKDFRIKYQPDYTWIAERKKEKEKKENQNNQSDGCYVATAVYGSYDCPEVWTLRRYRDNQLAKTWYGRLFIHIYYAISPIIVKWFGDTEWFKKMWKGKLDKMVKNLQSEGVEFTPYEDKKW